MCKILVVDDEEMIRTLVCNAIGDAIPRAEVVEADCGQRALLTVSSQAPFEVVITDIMMPGMDGIELAGRLQSGGCCRKFLFISGYADALCMERRMTAFPSALFLSKPFNIPALIGAVRELMAETGAPKPVRKAALRTYPPRASFRAPQPPTTVLDRALGRSRRIAAQNTRLWGELESAFASQQGWIQQITYKLTVIAQLRQP